jgi:hypothetical protein
VRERRGGVRIMLKRIAALVSFLLVDLLVLAGAAEAREGVVIRDGRTPIGYGFELEPHVLLGSAPPGRGAGSGGGVGVRASIVLSNEGFIRGVNDSIAIGFGLDYGYYAGAYGFYGYRDKCLHFEPGPAGTSVCTDVTSNGGSYNYFFVPVVMQWNFWFTERFSAFAEPGVSFYHLGSYGVSASGAFYVGGRFRVADRIALTARLGYPTLGFGVSFMM